MNKRVPNKDEYQEQIRFSREDIASAIKVLGAKITEDYPNGVYLLINQKASMVFVSDLIRAIDAEVDFEFLKIGSIQAQEDASPLLYLNESEDIILKGKDVIICTDIIRTGFTLHFLLNNLAAKNPMSLSVCTLLHNPEQQLIPLDDLEYVGYETNYDSLCGYGMPYQGKGRQFPDIVQLITEE